MDKKKILFICEHNSARSQMAEAFVNSTNMGFVAESAGLEPGEINPLVVEAMKEAGLDISAYKSKSVFALYKQGRLYDYVITVCDEVVDDKCPIFPGIAKRLKWPFEDPGKLQGDDESILTGVRRIRDEIRSKVEGWLKERNLPGGV